ncbi:MAG TPA: THxN family PEP-CTERM protein [Gammaproteobacteria bacterium]|nr:THxN family PEP-CTERM protein [Gammaproteobacteria bacterium]
MKLAKVLVSLAAAGFVLPASAALITINSITPAWVNPAPVAGISINNAGDPITARWGSPATEGGQSGYNFDDANTPVVVDTNVGSGRFLLGDFTHLNQPIFEPFLTSIGLSVSVDILGGIPGTFTEIFTLSHNETPNNCGCAPADNDIVTFSAGTLNSSFTVGGQSYILRLLGFSNNEGVTLLPSFSSMEGSNNSTQLWAQIVARPTQVPEPGTLLLMGVGLLSVALMRRRKQR